MDISTLHKHNYVPYSGSPSVEVVRSTDNQCFAGIRIENISYPLSITATQVALFNCLSEGHTPQELWTINTQDPITAFWEKELDITITEMGQDTFPDLQLADLRINPGTNPKEKLIELLDYAVVKESNFPVTALIETEKGFFSGVNVECSNWDMGLCAERIAIAKALTFGSKNLKTLHIHTRDGEFSSPCGACRQVLVEHMPNRQIHLHHADHSQSIHYSSDLLPHSFQSSKFLKVK